MMSGGQHNNSDNEPLILLGAGFAAVIGLWFAFHEQIAAVIMKLRLIESYCLVFDTEAREAIRDWLATTPAKAVTFGQLADSGTAAGRSLRFVVGAIVTALCGYLVYRSPERSGRYSRTYNTASLAHQESEEWKVIQPVLGQHIEDVPLDDPLNGMRARARDYGRKHGCIVRTASLVGDAANSVNTYLIDDRDCLLIKETEALFGKQLGRLWQGVNSLRTHERCLFAAFAAQANNDTALAQRIIDDLATGYVRARRLKDVGQINSLHAQKALHDHGNSQVVQKVCSRHAYVRTVLISLLMRARDNGILPPNWFRWLKTVDRVTWYALADVGLDVASVEAAGIRAHWLCETKARTLIVNPMIDAAVVALKGSLEEIIDEVDDDD